MMVRAIIESATLISITIARHLVLNVYEEEIFAGIGSARTADCSPCSRGKESGSGTAALRRLKTHVIPIQLPVRINSDNGAREQLIGQDAVSGMRFRSVGPSNGRKTALLQFGTTFETFSPNRSSRAAHGRMRSLCAAPFK